MLKGPGDFSPPDPVECPESCPHCSESRDPNDCPLLECIYHFDKDDYGVENIMSSSEPPVNQIINGDCLEVMKSWPANSIDMCMTSPPYYGLRDYGVEQIFGGDGDCEHEWGKEIKRFNQPHHDQSSNQMEVQKVSLEDRKYSSGNVCLKCHAWKGQLGLEPIPELYIEHMTEIFNEVKRALKKEGTLWLVIGDTYGGANSRASFGGRAGFGVPREGIFDRGISKCLCMIPERLSWSLIQNGWILRNKIIWYKPNAMPSSVKDRFSNRWEHLFLFSKNQKYYFDLDSVREPLIGEYKPFNKRVRDIKAGRIASHQYVATEKELKQTDRKGVKIPGQSPQGIHRKRHSGYFGADGEYLVNPDGKNPGDVFEINTQPFPEAHFAVFPERLCEKPIKAGCPERGVVLDPFCGAGTALYVAKQLRRRFIGIDVKQEYCDMSEKRLAQGVL